MSEVNKFSQEESPFKGDGKHAVFVGRWQPMHKGHLWLFNQKLEKGIPLLILIRDIQPDEKNPFTTKETERLLEQTIHKQKRYTGRRIPFRQTSRSVHKLL